MDAAILAAQRSGTAAMLAIIGEDYIVTRSTRVRTGTGGYADGPVTVRVVRMTVDAGNASLVRNQVARNVEGHTAQPTVNVVAAWDADLQEGDMFLWNGRRAYVDTISVDHEADTTLTAVLHG
jgi:hypothetical protein